jgi:drug/metabolite transporter (DMT)-like permease
MQKGVMVALASAVLFGMSTPFAKILVGSVSPLLLAGLLYAGSGLGLMLVFVGRRIFGSQPFALPMPQRAEWRWLVAAIFFGGVLGPVALMYGLVTSMASTASLLLNLEAVFTALLAWFLFR